MTEITEILAADFRNPTPERETITFRSAWIIDNTRAFADAFDRWFASHQPSGWTVHGYANDDLVWWTATEKTGPHDPPRIRT